MAKYKLSPKYEGSKFIGTIIDGERVNLAGSDYAYKTKRDTRNVPAGTELKYRGATEKDLKKYYERDERNNQKIVVKVEDGGSAKKSDAATVKKSDGGSGS